VSLVATYTYEDERGRPRLRKHRYSPRRFSMQAAKYANDRLYWKRGPGSVERWQGDWAPRALFNLPVVLDALAYRNDVTLVEGERDCLTLNALRHTVATTNWQGASKFTDAQAEWFLRGKGSRIHIIRDADDAGAFAAWERYSRLIAVGVARKRVRLWVPVGAKDITEAALVGLGGNAVRRESPGEVKERAFREGAGVAARGYLSTTPEEVAQLKNWKPTVVDVRGPRRAAGPGYS